jgi:Domain of unknown function (DUF4129)
MVKLEGIVRPTLLALTLLASTAGLAPAQAPESDPDKAISSALGKGSFPWYDPSKDQAKPFALPKEPEVDRAQGSSSSGPRWNLPIGNVIALVAFGLGLAALVGLLAWFWRIYEPIDAGEATGAAKGRGGPSRIEALPEGMRREIESSDPWEEALRRRDRGDLAGAVICLFAHQLLTLSRLGLVRLAPGRTGRQLLRSVVDADFRGMVHPTLRLFEAAYYGHRPPSPEEFARLWTQAEAFERRVAGGVVA